MKTYKELLEKINMTRAKMGEVIKDFQDSDAPQFKGKSDEKRRQMAIAAKLEADRGVKEEVEITEEEVEGLDEVSKKTLSSYIKKASGAEQPKNVMSPKNIPLTKIAAYQGDSETGHFGKRFNQATYDKAERLRKNRAQGISRAADKLAKEEVEQTDEALKGNQHKIDANKNGKVDGHDFKILRNAKKARYQ